MHSKADSLNKPINPQKTPSLPLDYQILSAQLFRVQLVGLRCKNPAEARNDPSGTAVLLSEVDRSRCDYKSEKARLIPFFRTDQIKFRYFQPCLSGRTVNLTENELLAQPLYN